jgi:hypothetical protein
VLLAFLMIFTFLPDFYPFSKSLLGILENEKQVKVYNSIDLLEFDYES